MRAVPLRREGFHLRPDVGPDFTAKVETAANFGCVSFRKRPEVTWYDSGICPKCQGTDGYFPKTFAEGLERHVVLCNRCGEIVVP
jgi:hypothetical protein